MPSEDSVTVHSKGGRFHTKNGVCQSEKYGKTLHKGLRNVQTNKQTKNRVRSNGGREGPRVLGDVTGVSE